MDSGAWWATVYGVAKSQLSAHTWLPLVKLWPGIMTPWDTKEKYSFSYSLQTLFPAYYSWALLLSNYKGYFKGRGRYFRVDHRGLSHFQSHTAFNIVTPFFIKPTYLFIYLFVCTKSSLWHSGSLNLGPLRRERGGVLATEPQGKSLYFDSSGRSLYNH